MADGSVTIDTSLDNKGFEKGIGKLGSIAKTGLKTLAAGATAAGVAFSGLVKQSIDARGEIEQQIGGVETLFKDSAKTVIKNAKKAYKTAGMSAIDYMQNVTSFSASLLQSVSGDTAKAAKIADMALIDMSDNANKMGTSMEAITVAYQGFAKQNYTMLDNLKLGYGGTKKEMERLLKDAQKITGVKYDINNLSDVYEAIHVIQGELGITGTTAKEATETLQGSASALKGAWNNFLSGAGDFNAVLDTLKVYISNVKRLALEAIKSIGKELSNLLGKSLEPIKKWIEEHKTALTIVAGVIGTLTAAIVAYTISQNLANIALGIYNGVIGLATTLSTAFGAVMAFITSPVTLVVLAIGALITVIVLLVQNWETVKQKTLEVWEGIKAGVSAGVESVKGFFSNLGAKISEKVDGIKTKLGEFGSKMKEVATTKIPQAINNISTFFSQLPGKLWGYLTSAISKFQNFCINLANNAKEGARKAVNAIKNGFANLPQNMVSIGTNIVKGIWNGIGNTANWLFEKIKGFKDAVLNKFKSFFGIHSPSTLFRDEIGDNLALGIGEGFNDSIGSVYKKMRSAVDFETQKLSANLSTTANVNRLLTAYIDVNGDINMDSEKVGRMTAPTVARTFRTAGAY